MNNNSSLNISGKADKPIENIEDNVLFPDVYIKAYEQYIINCETPMTISLQGAWGTGKTSLYYMLKNSKKLNDICIFHEFDALLYAQFCMDDDLPISLLKYICHEVDIDENYVNDCIIKIFNIAFRSITKKHFDKVYDINDIFKVEGINEIQELKSKFKIAVDKLLSKSGKASKLIFFIDNLDRIKSEKAIEIIETLHTFFSCEKCVFILAIDYAVVVDGANKKYGIDKGKDYFEKMIQLPFNMPTEYYNIKEYFKEKIKKVFGDKYEIIEENINDYLKFVELTIGTNPRAINRLINTFVITFLADYYSVDDVKNKYVAEVPELLFCLLSINFAYPRLYNYLVSKSNVLERESYDIDNYLNEITPDKINDTVYKDSDAGVDIKKINELISLYTKLVQNVNNELKNKDSHLFDVLTRVKSTGGHINI